MTKRSVEDHPLSRYIIVSKISIVILFLQEPAPSQSSSSLHPSGSPQPEPIEEDTTLPSEACTSFSFAPTY